jgi:ABC-type antimicrobial peptide transport system permease subunit
MAVTVSFFRRKFTVIGIAADARSASLKTAPPKTVYAYYTDRPPFRTYFLVRAGVNVDVLLSSIRRAIWEQDPNITIARVKTLDSQVLDSLASERFETYLLIAFAGSALLLAALGIHSILSYFVVSRRKEIGVRMAVGASRFQIYRLAAGSVGKPIIIGIALGLSIAIPGSRLIEKLLYGVRALDTLVIASNSRHFDNGFGVLCVFPRSSSGFS